MVDLYNTLNGLCKERGVKGGKMCTDLGISKSLMTDLKMGRKKTIQIETAQKIANYFGVSVGYLLGQEEQKENPITENSEGVLDAELVRLLVQLSPAQTARVLAFVQGMLAADADGTSAHK